MYINYYPILIIQAIISIVFILIRWRHLEYSGYLKLVVANLILGLLGLYVIPLRITQIRFFTVPPNLIPFLGLELNVIDISYLIMPFVLITFLICLLFFYQNSFKAVFIALGLSIFIQFLAYAVQSQRAEITFILIQAIGASLGYLLYLLVYNSIRLNIARTEDAEHG